MSVTRVRVFKMWESCNQEIFWLQTIVGAAYDLGNHAGALNPYC